MLGRPLGQFVAIRNAISPIRNESSLPRANDLALACRSRKHGRFFLLLGPCKKRTRRYNGSCKHHLTEVINSFCAGRMVGCLAISSLSMGLFLFIYCLISCIIKLTPSLELVAKLHRQDFAEKRSGVLQWYGLLTLIPATEGEGWNDPPCSFYRKSSSKQWNETTIFCDIVTDPLGFPMQLSIPLYLLPLSRGRFGPNVYMTGLATTSIVRLWSKDMNFTDVTFLNVRGWQW